MKPSVLIGIALGIVIIAAGVMAPYLQSAEQKSARKARVQAELAQRQLKRVSMNLPRLAELADPQAMKDADLESVIADAQEELERISREFSRAMTTARQKAEDAGLPGPEAAGISASAGGVRQALSAYADAVRDNETLLNDAIADAQAAMGLNAQALGVAQVKGMGEYVRAAQAFLDSERLRMRQDELQSEVLRLAAEWKLDRGHADHFRGLDVAPILSKLRADLDELGELREAASDRVGELQDQVAARTEKLAGVEARMSAARDELLALENRGFTAGDDASFNDYRREYLRLTDRLQALQAEEQELRYGGRTGAELVGVDPTVAELQGGEPVVGLETLQRRLETAEDISTRLNNAHVSLEEHIEYVVRTGQQAVEESDRYQARLTTLQDEQESSVKALLEVAAEATKKEEEAIRAARAASTAFGQAHSAAQQYVSAARQVQNERDTNRENPRLNAIVGDPYLEQFGHAAKAAADVLLGRIYAQRVASNESLLEDMRLFAEMKPDVVFDEEPFLTARDTARESGLNVLEQARQTYERLARSPQNTAWVPNAALAAAQHLSARLDEAQAGAFVSQAYENVRKAVEDREKNPYLREYVRFYYHLGGPAAGGGTSEPNAPAGDESQNDPNAGM